MAALSTLAAIAIGGLVGGALSGAGKKAPKTPALPVIPDAPTIDPTAPIKKLPKKSNDTPGTKGGTLLTGPTGLADSAPTIRKTLLGG